MSSLRAGDEPLHYTPSVHCWIAPVGVDQHLWEQAVREHLVLHLMDRPRLTRLQHAAIHREI